MYALISGLNAATVGIVALAAVFLSKKAITDKITRILVFLGGAAGLLYNALWYFPVLMFASGLVTAFWDFRLDLKLLRKIRKTRNVKEKDIEAHFEPSEPKNTVLADIVQSKKFTPLTIPNTSSSGSTVTAKDVEGEANNSGSINQAEADFEGPGAFEMNVLSWKLGLSIIAAFFITVITIMILRAELKKHTRSLDLLASLYLAGVY